MTSLTPLDSLSQSIMRQRIDALAKPPGSLTLLESLATWLAGVQHTPTPSLQNPRVIIFAADHGIAKEDNVSAYPSAVTTLMVHTLLQNKAAVSVLADQAGATLEVVDVGVDAPEASFEASTCVLFHDAKVAPGTKNMRKEAAMTPEQFDQAWQAGEDAVDRALKDGATLLAFGEMGIGNTTAATAVSAALTSAPVSTLVGPGTGISPANVLRKTDLIQQALHRFSDRSPKEVLRQVGGFELVSIAAAMLHAAKHRTPILLDGFIVTAAALAAAMLDDNLASYLWPATMSAEPGHHVLFEHLDLPSAIFAHQFRLGEASAATLAISVVRSALALPENMAKLADVLPPETEAMS